MGVTTERGSWRVRQIFVRRLAEGVAAAFMTPSKSLFDGVMNAAATPSARQLRRAAKQ